MLDSLVFDCIMELLLFKLTVLFDRVVYFRQDQSIVRVRRKNLEFVCELFFSFLVLFTRPFCFLQLLLENLLLRPSQTVGLLDSLVIMLWVIREEAFLVCDIFVVRLFLFLRSLPLPLALKDFVCRHEYSHPCQQPLGVRLFLFTVGYRSFTTLKLFLVLLIGWNCAYEEPLQLLKQEVFIWPTEAFWNVCSVSLLWTIEEA